MPADTWQKFEAGDNDDTDEEELGPIDSFESEAGHGDEEKEEAAPSRDTFIVEAATKLRAGFDQTTADCGHLHIGEVVEALEGCLKSSGYMRIRTSHGWVSTRAGDGTRLLRPVGEESASSSDSESENQKPTCG